jgi:hypothetical protein
MDDKGKLSWTNGHGKEETRDINYTIDIRDHHGEPGFALLAIAANTRLSVADMRRLLESAGVGRSRSWTQRRRWLFQQPGTVNSQSHPNADGNDKRAHAIMAANPTRSVRQLVWLLSKAGISRGREWVRVHRGDRQLPI